MSPGSMGHAIARQLQTLGLQPVSALNGRSVRTRALAATAGIVDVGNLARLTECDVILSVMNPGSALQFARDLAAMIKRTGCKPLVVDCNAIAPDTMHAVRDVIEASGASCVDGAVMGPPPPRHHDCLFPASTHINSGHWRQSNSA